MSKRAEEFKEKTLALIHEYQDVVAVLIIVNSDDGFEEVHTKDMCVVCCKEILEDKIEEGDLDHIIPRDFRTPKGIHPDKLKEKKVN
jgi:hypothetical protein